LQRWSHGQRPPNQTSPAWPDVALIIRRIIVIPVMIYNDNNNSNKRTSEIITTIIPINTEHDYYLMRNSKHD
jgi:hypothetical protein